MPQHHRGARRLAPARAIPIAVTRGGGRALPGRALALVAALGALVEWVMALAAAGYLSP